MTKNEIAKFVNPNTGRLSTRIKSYTDLSIEELFCIYNDQEKNEDLQFKSFIIGYVNKFKKSFIIDKPEDIIKYKHILISKGGRLETNKLFHVKFSVKEIYDIVYEKVICKNCNGETSFISFSKGYKSLCTTCSNKLGGIKAREKSKSTCLEKYGLDHPMKVKNIIDKKVNSTLKNGIYNNNPKKAKQTSIDNYGMIFQKTELFKLKRAETCLEKYGVDNPFKSETIKQEMKVTRRNTFITSGRWISDEQRTPFELYSKNVWKITNKFIDKIPNISKRGVRYLDNTAFEIDHMYSICQGFKDNIPPYIIGCEYNLKMIHWKENASKNSKCSITRQHLFKLFNESRAIK